VAGSDAGDVEDCGGRQHGSSGGGTGWCVV
jgi:hypothetical protein